MRRMAEINQARSEACHEDSIMKSDDNLKHKEGCDNQSCMTRIAEKSVLTNSSRHESNDNFIAEKLDSSGKPESRSKSAFNCLSSSASKSEFKYFNEEALTPSDVEYSDGARDLIQRLLNPDPQRRLRSLLSLQNIHFFKDFDFANVRTKKLSPREVLLRHYPDGPKPQQSTESAAYFFEDFDSIHI